MEVGGITMIEGIGRLESDPATDVIVLVSKPPASSVVKDIMNTVKECQKPVVVNFLDADSDCIRDGGGIPAHTLEDAAVVAAETLTGRPREAIRDELLGGDEGIDDIAEALRSTLDASQKYVRGLFSGGTFANEAAMILSNLIGKVFTNGKITEAHELRDPRRSTYHTCVDLGADFFTAGKPHPMLEPRMRRGRLMDEAADPETAVVLMDVVIGYGAHPDPAGELVSFISEAKQLAESRGRELPIVAHVCGVNADPQNREMQVQELKAADVAVMPSMAQATRLAALIATDGGR
jgi:FdrA protein